MRLYIALILYKNLLRNPWYSLGEGCSHVAAVLFKVECAVRLGYTSLTSQACWWNQDRCKQVQDFTKGCVWHWYLTYSTSTAQPYVSKAPLLILSVYWMIVETNPFIFTHIHFISIRSTPFLLSTSILVARNYFNNLKLPLYLLWTLFHLLLKKKSQHFFVI